MKINSFKLVVTFSLISVFFLTLFLSSPYIVHARNPLNTPGCNYAQTFIGKYEVKVGGVGLYEPTVSGGTVHNGTITIPALNRPLSESVNGPIKEAYLFWTIMSKDLDRSIRLNVNGSGFTSQTASQTFGPAKLNNNFIYYGHILDLKPYINSGAIKTNGTLNTFQVRKNLLSAEQELFGAGIIIIHENSGLSEDRHIDLKCGLDVVFENNIGNDPTNTKWGKNSNVVCHSFDPFTQLRNVQYYAFMSGTQKKTSEVYRPNAFYYKTGIKTGTNFPASILALNKPNPAPNDSLTLISGYVPKDDLFNGISGNQWDTINSSIGTPDMTIPANHNYLCVQVQSSNVPPIGPNFFGLGSSMKWSMSALSFRYTGAELPTPTPTPVAPTNTPVPTPTPIIYYPWVQTVGGNAYSQTFDQTNNTSLNINNVSISDTSNNYSFTNGISKFLSTYLFTQREATLPQRPSEKNFDLGSYTDNNQFYRPGVTWYEYFNQYFNSTNLNTVNLTFPSDTTFTWTNVSDIPELGGYSADQTVVIKINGDLNFDMRVCDRKAIFIISGDLFMTPNFVNSGYNNGCMFVVAGTTTVLPGQVSGTTPSIRRYDVINAFFISNIFITEDDTTLDGLIVKGGVVANEVYFERDGTSPLNQTSPSEIIEYDPRFMYIYGDLLSYIYGYNIRESQFIRSLVF